MKAIRVFISVIIVLFYSKIEAQDICNFRNLSIDSIRPKIGSIVRKSMSENDTCILSFIEYCKDSFIKTNKRKYLEIIDSCWKHSDGYVSDLIAEVSTDLFDEKFEGWFKYVYENRNDTDNRDYSIIKNLFMESMVEKGRQNAEKKINSVQASSDYTEEQKNYLIMLFKHANFSQ